MDVKCRLSPSQNGSEHSPVLKVLHLEDHAIDHQLVREVVSESGFACEFVHAADQHQFETALEQTSFDLIISDFTLPAYDGMAALAAAQKAQGQAPFIFVSGTIGEERAVESLKCGATDYILKSHLARLGPAIQRALREAKQREDRLQLELQLRQAQKMEAIGQLAGGVAHDFNNLLAVIRGNTELILFTGQQLEQPTREYLKNVTVAVERASNLTRQLLAFSRKQVMQVQQLDVNEVIRNLTKMLNRVIGEDIQLECSYESNLPLVEADLGMLEQVLMNLMVNARDAMPQGGRMLIATESVQVGETQARAHPEARPGQFVCWSVGDTGTGIAPEHLPRIYEPFFTTKPPDKGTGLGLATAYGIVKQHRGWIDVFTRLGAGTTFRIFLPAGPSADRRNASEPATAMVGGRGERILLVEDDQAVRQVTRRTLETFGYEVFDAASGKAAMQLWPDQTGEIDLLLTDVVLPEGVTGLALAEHLRRERPAVKIIMMSGYSRDDADRVSDFIRREKIRFLQKPFASCVLLDAVRCSLDER